MKVLVTGADGYIGAVLVPMLLGRGDAVTGLDTGYYGEASLYRGAAKGFRMIYRDIRDVEASEFEGFEAVVHLADLSNDPLGQLHPAVTRDINFEGARCMAQAAKQAGVERFVYMSSCSVYGIAEDEIVNEDSPTNPQTEYARCKLLVEELLTDLADDDFSPTMLRNATVYGPSPKMRFDIVVNNLSGIAWTEKRIVMRSDGTPWRPMVHIDDVCEGVVRVLTSPRERVHNRIFNLGTSDANYRIRQLAEMVAGAVEGCDIVVEANDPDRRSYRVSFERISEELGFDRGMSVPEGIRRLVGKYEEIGLTKAIFEMREFTRLRQIKHLLGTNCIDKSFQWHDKNERVA